jgi:succinoglycan biosynthesis transport protein ExoP
MSKRSEQAPLTPEWMHPLSVARMIWKRKVTFLCVATILSVVTGIVVRRLPAIYKSDAVVLVDSQKIPDRYVSSSVNADVGDRLATITQQILSSEKLKKIIQDFDLYRDDRKHLAEEEILEEIRKDIEIKVERGWTGNRPGAFRVGYRGPVPDVVAAVANRIANLFVDENLHARELQAEGTSEFIVNELEGAKKTLDQLEAVVSKYKVEHNGELPQQENALMSKIVSLQAQSQANQEAINRAQQTKVLLENGLTFYEAASAAAATSTTGERTTAGAQGRKPDGEPVKSSDQLREEALEANIEALRAHYSDQYPDLKVLITELARIRARRQAAEAPKSPAATQVAQKDSVEAPKASVAVPQQQTLKQVEADSRVTGLKTQLKLTTEDLENRISQQAAIQKEISAMQARVESLPVREQEMAGLLRDYEISKANYKSLLDKKISADMGSEMERRQKAERFTIVDPARVPEKPISPNRPLFLGLGIALSVVIALALSAGQDLRSGVILGEWELPPGVAVLGRVPPIEITKANEREDDPKLTSNPAKSGAARTGLLVSSRSPLLRLRRPVKDV